MICYRDMTFCEFYKNCLKGNVCIRALTPKVIEKAKKWWRDKESEPPICRYVLAPPCFKKRRGK